MKKIIYLISFLISLYVMALNYEMNGNKTSCNFICGGI